MFDVLPTLAGLAGAPLPANRKLDGMNIWPVLAGDPGARGHDEFLYFHGLDLRAVRSGPWKLHLPGANTPAAKKGEKKQAPAPGVQLYNLDSDIGEERNVAEQNPEIVQQLQTIAAAVESDLGVKTIGPGSRPLGRVKSPQPFIKQDGTVRADAVGTAKSFP